MTTRLRGWFAALTLLLLPAPMLAQGGGFPTIDSLVVVGASRNTPASVISASGLGPGMAVTYHDLQHALTVLMGSGQFDDVQILQDTEADILILTFVVVERPLLVDWSVSGYSRYSRRTVEGLIRLAKARALDRQAVAQARWSIDSMYRHDGYVGSQVAVEETPVEGGVALAFRITEGERVVIARLEMTGNASFTAEQLATGMSTRPESFWWFSPGRYDEEEIEYDIRDRLPRWYGRHGMIDFQVLWDSVIPAPGTRKALWRMAVEEGPVYQVGTMEVVGNQRYSQTELGQIFAQSFPQALAGGIGAGREVGGVFDRSAWEAATGNLNQLYQNNGYIDANVVAEQSRRVTPDGRHLLDLRWRVEEGLPAHINLIKFAGNSVTWDDVAREAIVLIPGQLYSQDGLYRSYQNLANLGYFEQPMPVPDVVRTEDGTGSVDIIFRVEERRTGTINFGASVGQGTGLGGFLGLEEPNLFGRGKRAKFSYNFGKNISDFSLTYSDPALRGGRVSGNFTLFNSRQRYIIGDLGRQRQEGVSLQFGLPALGSRYSRLFASYGFQRIRYDEGSEEIQARYQCAPCARSSIGLSFLRDTRLGMPFPVSGALVSVGVEQNGGILGGTGDYRKLDVDTRWFLPLGRMGGGGNQFGGGVQFTLGLTAKSGFIFGNPGGFFTQLYTLGGVQYGVPLRGYDEFSITPQGFDPNSGGTQGSANAFGKSYVATTVEAGARISQSVYVSTFLDAGNVFRTARQFDPTRLYRGAGFGVALISPLGPMGVDVGYGFDRIDLSGRPKPGWQLHLKFGAGMGN